MWSRAVDRLACVDLAALPLQLLLQEHPEWRTGAVAVVAEDKPQAPLLYVNEAARDKGVLPGQRFAAALALAKDLRAGTIPQARIEASVASVAERLRRHSPEVEPAAGASGVFWIDASGLGRLHPSLVAWAHGIAADLQAAGLEATVVVGFSRFGTYAVARSGRGIRVFVSAEEEGEAAHRVRLARLDLDPDVRERLAVLGIRTVGALLALPAGGLRQRFGDEAYRLHELAAGRLWAPLQPLPPVEPKARATDLEAPDANAHRLLFQAKRLLDDLLADLARRGEALVQMSLRLKLDDGNVLEESLRPAAPSLDGGQLLNLLRLRLETLRLTAGVVELGLTVEGRRAEGEQVRLFRQAERDLAALHRAFARLRAELGDDAVVRPRLREGHLPTARFAWEPLEKLPERLPSPRTVVPRPMVRRIGPRTALPPRPRQEPDGWLLRGIEHGSRVERLDGPYVVSGGWWSRGVDREYYLARTNREELLWIYHDRRRRRFFLECKVE
jgi:protein ImuB